MITLDENTIALWMIPVPPDRDFLFALMRNGAAFEVVGRLRIYNPASTDPFDSKDQKHWMKKEIAEDTVEAALKNVRTLARNLEAVFQSKAEEVRAESSEGWIRALQAKKWIHMQSAPIHGRPHEN